TTRPSDTNITRRKMLKTVASASLVAAPLTAVSFTTTDAHEIPNHSAEDNVNAGTGKLYELIADFDAIEVELCAQMDVTDSYLGGGKDVPDHIWATQFAVGDRLDAAALTICAYRPANAA